jgi:hypothetical protein
MSAATRAQQDRDDSGGKVLVEVDESERATDTVAGALEHQLERLLARRERLLYGGMRREALEAEIDSLLDQLEMALRSQRADDRALF